MRFPSVAALAERAGAVLRRFPWPLAAGTVAAAAAIIGTDVQEETFWVRLCLVAMLGIPLTLATTLLVERRNWEPAARTGLIAAGVLALFWFLRTWPDPEQKHLMIRYVQLSAGLHLLVAVAPFAGRGEVRGFWQYNRRLFEGFLRAALFSAVLFVGLAIALGALDKLFGVNIEGETYGRLWFIIAFVINTWIFLAAVPPDIAALEEPQGYPRALKVFTQYILTPLVAVYLVILTAYLVKIVITGTWPSGWIGYLVSSVATVGILGFLLVHPLRAEADEAWIRTYARYLFVGLIPAAAMFLLALWKRVEPYGLTELRYLGLLLGAWLLGLSVLYTVRRETGIKIIPVSLAVILLLTAFGPIGATALSVRSQADRIRAISESANVRLLGRVAPDVKHDLPLADRRQMSEALRFLLERNASGAIRGLFGDAAGDLAAMRNDGSRYAMADSAAGRILAAVGIDYLPEYYTEPIDYVAVEPPGDRAALPISGFDYALELNGRNTIPAVFGSDTLAVVTDTAAMTIALNKGGESLLVFQLRPLVDTLLATSPADRSRLPLQLAAEGAGRRGMLALAWLGAERKDGRVRLNGWRGVLYLGN